MVNRSLRTLFRCLVGENLRAWDTVLFTVEFVYNNSVNKTTDMSPFEIVTGYRPKALIDLILMSASQRPSESVSAFASHLHVLHQETRRRIAMSNENYKQSADLHRLHRKFQVNDLVMVHFRTERYPPEVPQKLHVRSSGPYKVLNKIGPNAYVLDILTGLGISSSFNIEDLISYHDHSTPDFEPFADP